MPVMARRQKIELAIYSTMYLPMRTTGLRFTYATLEIRYGI